MKILFLSTKNPFPIVDGHTLRTYNLIKHCSKEAEITLLTFVQSEGEISGVAHMGKICKEVHVVGLQLAKWKLIFRVIQTLFSFSPFVKWKYSSKTMQTYIQKLLASQNFDIVHFDLLPLAQYIPNTGDIPTVLVNHNVESSLLKRRALVETFPRNLLFFLDYLKLRRWERKWVESADVTVTVSQKDEETLSEMVPHSSFEVVENGVDTEYYYPSEDLVKENTLIYVGGLNWFPNLDAVRYFKEDILPILKRQIPDIKLQVVGTLSPKATDIAGSGIELLGFVDDERLFISESAVFIVPLRIGGGTRLKILNALSMKKAIVSTSIGCEGINVTDGKDILIADDPQEFAHKVLSLIQSPQQRKLFGEEGRKLVTSTYDWGIISSKMKQVYRDLSGKQ